MTLTLCFLLKGVPMRQPYPIDFVRLVSPYVRDVYEMRGTRRESEGAELIWWHPNMRDFLYMDAMSKKDISQFAAMNVIINEAYRLGYVELAPIYDDDAPFYKITILDKSNYLYMRRQVIPEEGK